MSRRSAWLSRAYVGLLRLYPARYRAEFGQERSELFTLALQEAAGQGERALLMLAWRELRDLPASALRANLREWEAVMKTIGEKLGEEHFSWYGLLLGVWPFIFLGPVMAVAPYLPGGIAQALTYDSPLWLATILLSLAAGILAGWREGFPRWAYPHLVTSFFVILVPLLAQVSQFLGPERFERWVATAIFLVAILGLGGGLLFLASRLPPTRKILRDMRADWTRLSFGMLVYLAFVTGFNSGDHLPPFSPWVWLPPALVVLGAVAYLLCRSRLARSLALITALLVTVVGKVIASSGEAWSVWPILIVVLLILLPALAGLLPGRGSRQVVKE